ncbi:cholesterol esterase [Dactylosporangium vinaceum]|nr:cholesterol esterase [Dactylosporangium vinaceum]UWZ50164.1 cholesterol esterase [Dactylosporangium matsuzakiense]
MKGGTRWKRFATVVVPASFIAGAIVFGQATGAIAASFNVSGSQFKVSADRLEGTGFVQYGGFATEKGGDPRNPADPKNHAVAVSGIAKAKLFNLCQSVKVPNLPVTMVIHAGKDPKAPAEATDLLIDLTSLKGDATFDNIQIGIDASDLSKGGVNAKGLQGSFAQQADGVVITGLKQVAWSTTAGTFKLTGLDLSLSTGPNAEECF